MARRPPPRPAPRHPRTRPDRARRRGAAKAISPVRVRPHRRPPERPPVALRRDDVGRRRQAGESEVARSVAARLEAQGLRRTPRAPRTSQRDSTRARRREIRGRRGRAPLGDRHHPRPERFSSVVCDVERCRRWRYDPRSPPLARRKCIGIRAAPLRLVVMPHGLSSPSQLGRRRQRPGPSPLDAWSC